LMTKETEDLSDSDSFMLHHPASSKEDDCVRLGWRPFGLTKVRKIGVSMVRNASVLSVLSHPCSLAFASSWKVCVLCF